MSNITPFRRRASGQPDLPSGRNNAMSTVLLASHGSGAGRTTLAAHMAVQAGITGDGPVGVLDADPKGDLSTWWNRRQGKMDSPAFGVSADIAGLVAALSEMQAAGARLCVIDSGPGDADSLAPLARVADLAVIPCDVHPGDVADAAALGQALSRHTAVAYVVNCRAHSGGEPGNALSAMASGGGWPAGTVQYARSYAISMTAGRAVTESHAGTDAAHDIAELWATLRGILVAG